MSFRKSLPGLLMGVSNCGHSCLLDYRVILLVLPLYGHTEKMLTDDYGISSKDAKEQEVVGRLACLASQISKLEDVQQSSSVTHEKISVIGVEFLRSNSSFYSMLLKPQLILMPFQENISVSAFLSHMMELLSHLASG